MSTFQEEFENLRKEWKNFCKVVKEEVLKDWQRFRLRVRKK